MRRARVSLLVLILVALATGGAWVRWAGGPPGDEATTIRVSVPQGTALRTMARRLEREGVVRSATYFEIYVRARGDERSIQAGTYDLPQDRPLSEIVDLLVSGETVLVPFTVPEGLRLEQIAGYVGRALAEVDSAAFFDIVHDPLVVERAGVDAESLEGYLFPETYLVRPDLDARGAVDVMVAQFWSVFTPAWRARADSIGRSVHEIVTLASIVEEEARVADERTAIASVFWNRLARGMALEADPTVQYALGGHRTRVLYRDLEVDSPYNTYRNTGLPPGPIAAPGAGSLKATLYPDSLPYLFFVATGEGGRHTFSRTLAEHNRKRREMNR